MNNPIHSWEDDGGAIYAPDYDARYLRDETNTLSPEEPINPDKVGVIDNASVGIQVSCTGFLGLSLIHI